ncbi:MAG: hypothetical protein ACYS5F_14705 [Planctomycetota bacterium]
MRLTIAITDYANDLPSSFGSNCQVCHVSVSGGGALNSFGSDYAEHDNDIDVISRLDSDGDGSNNEKELKAGTFPGDPDSKPMQGIPGFPFESIILGIASTLFLFISISGKNSVSLSARWNGAFNPMRSSSYQSCILGIKVLQRWNQSH